MILPLTIKLPVISALPDTFKLFPILAVPLTLKLVNVPTLVIFDCVPSTTVFAVLACEAFATVPVTFAPCMLLKLLPLPIK